MTDFTTYFEDLIIAFCTEGSDFPAAPTDVYIALHDGPPGANAASNELSYASYSRVGVSTAGGFTRTSSPEPTGSENASKIEFGIAGESWGDVSHFSIWDSASGGNAYYKSALDTTRTINADDEIRFLTGDLDLQID